MYSEEMTSEFREWGDLHTIGYVWNCNRGERIVIVVDDHFSIPRLEKYGARSAHAFGLLELRDKLINNEFTRAIGFFKLPDPGSPSFQEDTCSIVNSVYAWIDSISDGQCYCRVLVDYFYGEGLDETAESGTSFVRLWKEHERYDFFSERMDIAHLSIGGISANNENSGELRVFSKREIYPDRELPSDFREWLKFSEHPLTRLWRMSSDWFTRDDPDEPMKHGTENIRQCFTNPTDKLAQTYRRTVEEALGFQTPDGWWVTPESVGNLHEALKCLCGYLASSQTDANAKRMLSTGAAFFVALMAHQQECGTLGIMVQNPNLWLNCRHVGVDSPIFAKQDRAIAEASAHALYDFFRRVFQVRDSSSVDGNVRQSQVERVGFLNQGKSLVIQLVWNAHQHAPDRRNSLAESMTDIFQQESIKVPKLPTNTREALVKLWAFMAISETGCFAPGTIYLDGKTLTIACTK